MKQMLLFVAAVMSAIGLAPRPGTEVLWDSYGVPHIYAADEESAFRALGCAQLQSHGDLLLRLYGRARGRAAEYWGETYLDNDRWVRTNQIPARSRQWYEQQDPVFRRSLDAFAEGINTCAVTYREALLPEVRVVLPVSAVDVLAHAQRVLYFSFVVSPRQVAAVAAQFRPAPRETGAEQLPLAASNAWAIAPAHTAAGHSLLLANPHLSWSDQSVFYEVQVVAPGVDVYGATLVGFPVLGIAFTERHGWTHTVNTHDGADLFQLTSKGDGYLFDGQVRSFETETETIKVRGQDGGMRDVPLIVRRSVHGPVVAQSAGGPVALRVAGLDRAGALRQWWDMARAKNLRDFQAVLARVQIPVFAILYADRDGHILHLFNGHVPVRPAGAYDWAGIVPGDTSATLWTRTHAFEELPRVVDPPSGWLQSSNDPPWSTTFPRVLDPDRFPAYLAPRRMGFRTARSLRLLMERPRMTLTQMIDDKYSTRAELADRMLDELLAAVRNGDDAGLRRAGEVLAQWDRCADAGSRGAVLFEAFARRWFASTAGRPFATAWTPDRPIETPSGIADVKLALTALAEAAADIEKRFGRLDVTWGETHRLRRGAVDLPANGGPGDPLGLFHVVDYGPSQEAVFGDSFIAAVEFASPLKARVLVSYGNASQPGSRHQDDQLALLARKQLRTAWRTRADVLAHLERREQITALQESVVSSGR